ncbi:CaiB/BaiF CoA transferase family protein [Rhizohabitans arisaemae]|uniref:CaiB/BaiF CoA transferase family protein n=1 Tax=Rhizohabitans arisaemae TaxID=2720610 RepID=UPI0024B0F383|nr:CaiB/BaiF CoA-transferase family protein [Rhizohabitans arisaemae]
MTAPHFGTGPADSGGHPAANGPLAGIRVLELAGLAPGPFAGMMLADHGAEVLRIERVSVPAETLSTTSLSQTADARRAGDDVLDRGKQTIGLDLKRPEGVAALKRLAENVDVLIEVYRPGVAERLGIGPADMHAVNERLVYGRLTGWGQDGPLAPAAGHDLDYLAISGVLSQLGRAGERPTPPVNLLADFAGGGLLLAYGVLLALVERAGTGRGQVVDAAMTDGSALLFGLFFPAVLSGTWGPRGTNLLDSGAPMYDTYRTADGGYVAVAPLEPAFWDRMCERMGLTDLPDRTDRGRWPELRRRLEQAFLGRTRAEWEKVFEGSDACVFPVLEIAEAPGHPHNAARRAHIEVGGVLQPAPAPRLTGHIPAPAAARRLDDLTDWGISTEESAHLRRIGVLT